MAKYRRIPIIVEAEQFKTNNHPQIEAVCMCAHTYSSTHIRYHIHTDAGVLTIIHNDWIITDARGALSICKPNIFMATYEIVVSDRS